MSEPTCLSIDDLPPEVLQMVFDLLPLKDRKPAALVNRKWRELLRANRFISRTALKVCASTLDSDWALEAMKRPYRRVIISSDRVEHGPQWISFRDRLQKLIASDVIQESVQSMIVIMSARAVSEVFDQSETIWFTKLEQVTYSPGTTKLIDEDVVPQINVYAPNLNRLKIDCLNQSCVEFIRIVSPKLKRLILRFFDKAKLIEVMSITSFSRLRELCIYSFATPLEQEKMLSTDIGDAFEQNLGNLHMLSIRDDMNTFPYVYHVMFAAASNLTYLNVEGIEMHPLALYAVNNITKLQVLQLLADTTYQNWSCEFELHLPELKVLLLSPKLMAQAGYLPKLQNFAIQNHSVHIGLLDEYANEALATYAKLSTIQQLHLQGIVFSEETLDVVCSFRSSPQIVLEDIWDNIQVLHQIVNSYPNLKWLKLVHCRFKAEEEDPHVVGDASDDSEWETLQQAESVGQTFEFFTLSKLEELFPNCKVEVHDSYFLKHIGYAPWRLQQTVDEIAKNAANDKR
ncbi:hypothetical protein RP20_CCG024390 [Aedes albopictus]|nr:hypothetical protein RP20_CCG024390 [Aedes albopictus]